MPNNKKGYFTQQEILSQPATWAKTLQELAKIDVPLSLNKYENLVFIGCGSTYYLSLWASRLAQSELRINAVALPSSEVWFSHEKWIRQLKKPLLIAVSRSGETSETLHAVETFKYNYGKAVLGITCYPESELARLVDKYAVIVSGQEQSIAQTRSFTNMMLGALYLIQGGVPKPVKDRMAEAAQGVLEQNYPIAKEIGNNLNLERFFFLGNGALYGLASEIMLKMKEMSLSYSEAFHFMEFRHGPMSMVNAKSLITGYLDDWYREHADAVMKQMQSLGAKTLGIGYPAPHKGSWHPDWFFNINIDLPAIWRYPLYLPLLQSIAFHRSIAKGLDPDRPLNLSAVVELDE